MKTSNFSHVCDAINIIVRHLFSLPISLVHYSIMSTLEFASISSIYAHNRNITEALPGKKDKKEKKKGQTNTNLGILTYRLDPSLLHRE